MSQKSTSLEVSDAVGGDGTGTLTLFNDYYTASKGAQKITKVILYHASTSKNEVIGIRTTYSGVPASITQPVDRGDVSGTTDKQEEVNVAATEYIIAAIATVSAGKITSVVFNVSNTTGTVNKVPDRNVGAGTAYATFGNITAFHGTIKNSKLDSLGFQVLQTR